MDANGVSVVAFVPARGGSKEIPQKNIALVGQRPLIWWSLDAALKSRADRVVVSTDSVEIACIAQALSPRVEIFWRGADTASDTATSESALVEWASVDDFSHVLLIQSTSPLTLSEDVDAVMERMATVEDGSVVTVTRRHVFLWDEDGVPLNYTPATRPRRQDWSGVLVENGAIYARRRSSLLGDECRVGVPSATVEMPQQRSVEVDTRVDLSLVDALLRQRSTRPNARTDRPLRMVLADVDGTLTDGRLYWGEAERDMKGFNARDGKGFQMLREAGLLTAIVTGEASPFIADRASKLKVDHCGLGVVDKLRELIGITQRFGIGLDQMVYVGDDVQDLAAMAVVRESWCPNDSHESARLMATHVSGHGGGGGCFREVADVCVRSLNCE